MKTKIYLVSALSLTIGLSMQSQTNNTAAKKSETETSNATNKRTLSRLGGKTVPDDMNAENPLAVKTANISGESDRNELLKLAEALAYQAQRLKNESNLKTGHEKDILLSEAALYEKKSLQKQIEASDLLGKMNQVKFNSNRETLHKLSQSTKLDDNKLLRSNQLITSSEKNMQLAKSLREDSYKQPSLVKQLGIMGNAEEKEVLALGEQNQAIDLLYKRPKTEM